MGEPMPVPNSIDDLSATPADNYPGGSEQVFPNLDDYLRFHAACIAQLRDELQVIGTPLAGVSWWGGARSAITLPRLPADGQLLNRADHPELWTFVSSGGYPMITEADWQSTPLSRGSFSSGNGSTTFRMPDLNGKQTGSIGAVVLRGDGAHSAGSSGEIQESQNLSHTHGITIDQRGSHVHQLNDPGHNHYGAAQDVGRVAYVGPGTNYQFGPITNTNPATTGITMGASGSHTHTATVGASGGVEARGKSATGVWVMRVK